MERIQSFEIHDLPGCPEVLRESVTESLGNGLRWSKLYAGGAAELFHEFCRQTNCDSLLDLCSGSGEPVSILLDGLQSQGLSAPRVTLSDLYPNTGRMQNVVDRHSGKVSIHQQPLDATAVPESVEHGARSIISAFHHFPPQVARGILKDCVEKRKGIFILEPMPRRVYRTLSIAAGLVAGTALNPLLANDRRAAKAFLTYAVPVIPAVNAWDSLISLLRVHSRESLMAMVEPFGEDFRWDYHEIPVKWGGRITVFTGVPKQAASDSTRG